MRMRCNQGGTKNHDSNTMYCYCIMIHVGCSRTNVIQLIERPWKLTQSLQCRHFDGLCPIRKCRCIDISHVSFTSASFVGRSNAICREMCIVKERIDDEYQSVSISIDQDLSARSEMMHSAPWPIASVALYKLFTFIFCALCSEQPNVVNALVVSRNL